MAARVVVGVRKVGGWRIWRVGTSTSVEVREPLGALREAGATSRLAIRVSRGRRPLTWRAVVVGGGK